MKLQIARMAIAAFLSSTVFSLSAEATPFTFESNGLSSSSPQLDFGDRTPFTPVIDIRFSFPALTYDAGVEQAPRLESSERSGFALMTLGLAGPGFGGTRRGIGTPAIDGSREDAAPYTRDSIARGP